MNDSQKRSLMDLKNKGGISAAYVIHSYSVRRKEERWQNDYD